MDKDADPGMDGLNESIDQLAAEHFRGDDPYEQKLERFGAACDALFKMAE